MVDGGLRRFVFLFGHPDRNAFLRAFTRGRDETSSPLGLLIPRETEAALDPAIAWFVGAREHSADDEPRQTRTGLRVLRAPRPFSSSFFEF